MARGGRGGPPRGGPRTEGHRGAGPEWLGSRDRDFLQLGVFYYFLALLILVVLLVPIDEVGKLKAMINLPSPAELQPSPCRGCLQEYYAKWAPDKLGGIEAVLEKYAGKEKQLFGALHRKYGKKVNLAKCTGKLPPDVQAQCLMAVFLAIPVLIMGWSLIKAALLWLYFWPEEPMTPAEARSPTHIESCSAGSCIQDLPPEILVYVCQHLGISDLVHVAMTCKLFRHGGLETVELPSESPVVAILRERAFARPELVPCTRPIGCSESWVAYLARCARQRRYREAPFIAAGNQHSLFLDVARRVLACGTGAAVGHGDVDCVYPDPTPVIAMAGVQVRSLVAGPNHSLALAGDGWVYSWGINSFGQLGHGDTIDRRVPAMVTDLEGVRGIASGFDHSLAVTQAGAVFRWGNSFRHGMVSSLSPITVEGFEGVHVCQVYARMCTASARTGVAFALGEDGELFSWGCGRASVLGHGDTFDRLSPKRVEALLDVRVSSVAVGHGHVLALAEDGLVYAWGENHRQATLGNPKAKMELLPRPVEALQSMRMGSVAAGKFRSYAVSETGELWAWGVNLMADGSPLGHGELENCLLPRSIESLRSMKMDVVVAGDLHTLALAEHGDMYVWGIAEAAKTGALGLGHLVQSARRTVRTPLRISALREVYEGM